LFTEHSDSGRDRQLVLNKLQVLLLDNKIKEVWINGGGKSGTERFDILTEIGRIVSVALQNGTPLEELVDCATYHSDGRPSTVVGLMFDHIKDIK
jgi:hypothetical protein